MKTIEELGISPTPWKVVYDPDNGVPFRIECTRPMGCSNRVVDDFDGILDSDARLIADAPKMYEALYLILRCWGHGILAEGGFACEHECTDDNARCTWEDCPILKKARAAISEASGEEVC